MIAEQIMHTNLHTISPTNTVREGLQVMREHKIRHLPVVNERMELIGLVTEHDIKAAAPSNLLLEPNFEFNNITQNRVILFMVTLIVHKKIYCTTEKRA